MRSSAVVVDWRSVKGGARWGLVIALLDMCIRLTLVWVESGYGGKPFAVWVFAGARITVGVVKRSELRAFRVVSCR